MKAQLAIFIAVEILNELIELMLLDVMDIIVSKEPKQFKRIHEIVEIPIDSLESCMRRKISDATYPLSCSFELPLTFSLGD